MSNNMHNDKNMNGEGADNLSQNDMDEALSSMLNTDDSGHGEKLLNDDERGGDADKLQAEVNELKDKHLRLMAEFENYRRRTSKEILDIRLTAGREVVQALLTVLDDMGRAEVQLEKSGDVAAIKEGVSLVFNKLRNVLQQKGLKKMDAAGADFDPDVHEAITEIPAPTPDMAGKVIDMVEPGYYLNDKLIRHAKVVVGKGNDA